MSIIVFIFLNSVVRLRALLLFLLLNFTIIWVIHLYKIKKLTPTLRQLSSLECKSCQLGKHHRVFIAPRVNKWIFEPFLLVHSDILGPRCDTSKFGFKYFIIFVDNFSRITWFYLMKDCSELYSIFCAFVTEIKNQFGVPIHIFRSDNMKEYYYSF